MSDTETQTHIIALKLRVRDLELQAVEVRARYEEAVATLDMLEHPRRARGRPRNVSGIIGRRVDILEMPDRVTGGTAENEPEDAA